MVKGVGFLVVLEKFFTVYLPKTKGLSDNTIRSYRYAFRLLLTYVYTERGIEPSRVSFSDLEGDVIEEWLTWLEESRGCSARTRNQRRAAMVTFARFAIKEDFDHALSFSVCVEQIPRKKHLGPAIPAYLTRDEMAILLRLPDQNRTVGRRDQALLSTLYATGARAQELCDIRVVDVRFGEETTVTLHGKGGKSRVVTIPDQCAKLLRSYIKWAQGRRSASHANTFMFASQIREHMTISCVETIVKKYVILAKYKYPGLFRDNYTPHSFRQYGESYKLVSD